MAACTALSLLYTPIWIILIHLLQWTSAQDYSSQWAAHIEGGLETAQKTSEKHGFVLLGEVNNLLIILQNI